LSADGYYTPTLRDFGLKPIFEVDGSRAVIVWEIPYAIEGTLTPPPPASPFTVITWSFGPITCLLAALALEARASYRRAA
jgi:hypothetical protein